MHGTLHGNRFRGLLQTSGQQRMGTGWAAIRRWDRCGNFKSQQVPSLRRAFSHTLNPLSSRSIRRFADGRAQLFLPVDTEPEACALFESATEDGFWPTGVMIMLMTDR
ncbi:Ig-like domain-containing surface protein [Anopheles sinensis]|uniref:Ig-like domain-containing surface protein n=1 Tax=Anopheles sinensis TaxID=74873 RepID=A0A084VIH5_ANOSI|nr:Ig-like domain-containing surface protein [Anopheles sinensis]